MFCPRCAAENEAKQAYCRQCGLALADVGLALQGTTGNSLAKIRSGSHLMNGGVATLASFMVIAVIITLIGITQGHPVLATIAMLNALLGALVGLPLIVIGKTRVSQAARLLSGEESSRTIAPQREIQSLTAGAESEINRLHPPNSVTEGTTRNLSRER